MSAQHPSAVAVETTDHELTYAELNDRADRLAEAVLDVVGHPEGVDTVDAADAPSATVAMQVSGTATFLVTSLALARAGCVAVPVDPTAPPEWRDEVLRDCDAKLLLTDLELGAEPTGARPCPAIDPRTVDPAPGGPVDLPRGRVSSIIYTSGSTGIPKGVVMPTIDWDPNAGSDDLSAATDLDEFGKIESGMRAGFMGQGSVGWAHQLLLSSMTLRSTIVAYEVRGLASETIGDWMARTAIESFVTVPTMLRHLLNTLGAGVTLPHLRLVMLYGETTTWEDLDSLFAVAPDATVIVMFGSTESGFFASSMLTAPMPRSSGPIPIGKPITGYDVQIEDDLGQAVPDGEIGELVVVSPEPSLGYWHRPELDQAVFETRADDRVHIRTGDRARRLPDGSIEHLGRKDHLVKVAGNRVELGEVEAALLRLPGVADAVAAPYQDHAGASRLTAAVVPRPGAVDELSPRSLRAELARRLPAAMVPDEVAVLSELPRLTNGKVDRRQLAATRTEMHAQAQAHPGSAPAASSPTSSAAAPHAETLRGIWCTVLERSDVDLDDDFFDLGGDSLRAIELFVEIERELGIRAVPTLLLEAPRLSDLAHALGRRPGTGTFTIPIQPGTEGTVPLFVVNAGTSGLSVARLSEVLGTKRPIYEVWAGADEARFEDVAARCVAELCAAVPSGPYALYGFSLSGVIAFEMGLQLQAAGRKPSLLVLGDSPAPGESPLPAMAYGMWRRTIEDPRPAALLRRVLGKVRDEGLHDPQVERMVEEPTTSPFLREWHQHLVLASSYRPRGRLDCPTVLHRSSDSPIGKRGWSRHVARRVQVRDIPGPHAHQVKAGVPDVARSLAADLARIDALGAPPFAASRLGR